MRREDMDTQQFERLYNAVLEVDAQTKEANQAITGLKLEVAVIGEKISHTISESQLIKAVQTHINEYHAKRKYPSKPPSAYTPVSWGAIMKYTGIIFGAVSLGMAVGKYLV